MALTLSDCFEYAGIDITELDGNTFNEVKKILLLELKSSGDDTLLIAGERYSKNDILQFFEHGDAYQETAATQEPDQPAAVHRENNWHQVLAKPEELTELFDMPDALLDRDALEEAKQLVERQYGKEVIRVAQRQFRDGEYDRLQLILSYAPVFSGTFSYDLKQALFLLLKNWMMKLERESQEQTPIADFKALPFFSKGFYSTLHFLKDMDGDLTRQIMRAGVDRCRGQELSWQQKKDLFQQFYLLPMDADSEAYIKKNIAYFDERIREEATQPADKTTTTIPAPSELIRKAANTPGKIDSFAGLIRAIVLLAAVLVGGYFVYDRYFSDKAPGKAEQDLEAEIRKNAQAAEEQFENYYFDKEDVIKDYKKLKAAIEQDVTNPVVRGFMVNELSRFAYDQDVDSLTRIDFVPVQPVPECVPLKFSNGSKFSRVLVLIYNEEDPAAPVRGALIPQNTNYEDTTLYILPTDRVFVLFNPEIENGHTVVASKMASIEIFNTLYESYRLKPGTPKNDVYLSSNEYQKGAAGVTHIYETMRFKRLNQRY